MASTSTHQSTSVSDERMQEDLEAGAQAAARIRVSETRIPSASGLVGTVLQGQPRETELHQAVRQRANLQRFQELSLRQDADELAETPDLFNMPPLYLAVHLGYSDITEILIQTFGDRLSSGGPNGQNVLHVAALRSRDLTQIILKWRGGLSNQADGSGDTPLHFAASVGVDGVTSLLLQNDNNGIMTQANKWGMCPIHIAASVGAMDATLALEEKRKNVVEYVCRKSQFESILNMKDQDGNTALHLAVKRRDKSIFSHLLGNRLVELNHVNNEGYTPLDIASMTKIEQSYASDQNPTEWMIRTLAHSGAQFSACRRGSTSGTMQNHQEDLAQSTESVLVASALIATLTFAAAFTMPGSYKTESDPMAGTPALGRHYGFKVFLVADILAFFCSVAATYSLAEYGNRGDPLVRCIYARRAVRFFHVALKSVIIAFTLGVSVVMWDISVLISIFVAVAASVLVLYGNEALANDCRLMWVMYRRFGLSLSWTLYPSTRSHLDWNTWRLRSFSMTLAWNTIKLFSTYIIIFVVAYVAQLKQKSVE